MEPAKISTANQGGWWGPIAGTVQKRAGMTVWVSGLPLYDSIRQDGYSDIALRETRNYQPGVVYETSIDMRTAGLQGEALISLSASW